ncbi:MAG: hypothetical protein WA001_02035 [Patescibacteria group bacterium]
MGSHRDDDAAIPAGVFQDMLGLKELRHDERLAAIRKEAEAMTLRGENRITAGEIGEAVLYDKEHRGIQVRRLPNDPLGVLRLSIGESPDMCSSAYLVFRGKRGQCIALLERALAALREAELNK